jgi:hypothetical protein
MGACTDTCCTAPDCCQAGENAHRLAEQSLSRETAPLGWTAPQPQEFVFLYHAPAQEQRSHWPGETRVPHTLPRLAATCIQLI